MRSPADRCMPSPCTGRSARGHSAPRPAVARSSPSPFARGRIEPPVRLRRAAELLLELAQSVLLDLPYPLARHAQAPSDLLEGPGLIISEAKAFDDHTALAGRSPVDNQS